MTIPVQPVQIHPQFVPYQGTPGMEMLLTALEHRRQLQMAQQKLQQDQQQFELSKRLGNASIAHSEAETMRIKQELKDKADDLAAHSEALGIVNGHLDVLRDSKAWGEVWARIKDPRVAGWVQTLRDEQLGSQQKAATLASTEASTTATETANANTTRTHEILQSLGPSLATPKGQAKAILRVAQEVGPDEANRVATAFNTGSGRYDRLAGPDGFVYIVDSKTGEVRQDRVIGQAGNQARVEAIRRNAGTLVDLLDEQSHLITTLGLGSSRNPTAAALAEGARVLGVPLEALSNMLRDDPQQLTRMLRTRFSHNYVGMLPNSRSAAQLLQNLAESYWAPPGSGDALLRTAERDRNKLRAVLVGVRDGKITDLSRIPGFQQAAQAAVSEGQQVPQSGGGPSAPPNPTDFLKPIQ